jgi:glutamyl-tRNA reductase
LLRDVRIGERTNVLAVVGLNQRTAALAQRELLAPRVGDVQVDLTALVALGGVDEVAAIANCWRFEVYAATRCPAAALLGVREALIDRAGRPLPLFGLQGVDAFRHLARVAAGLESPMLGEAQILSQLKDAFERAMDTGAAGIELISTLERVLHVARRVRAEVPLEERSVSWGHAVTALADKVLGPVAGRRVAVIGAGEVARGCIEHLRTMGGDVVVLDRTPAAAAALAEELDAEARPLDALGEELLRADVVVSAAREAPAALGPERMERIATARRRGIVLVDLAVPRTIPPQTGSLPDVYLCDVDDLERVTRSTLGRSAIGRARAERVVEVEVRRWASGDAQPRNPPLLEAAP